MAALIRNQNITIIRPGAAYSMTAAVAQENASTLNAALDELNISTTVDNLAWCHDLQGSDFIYTPTLYTAATRHAIAAAFILLIIATVIGNALVIITVVVDKPLKKITRALVVSMAASDILVALCGELQSVVTMLDTDTWVLSDILCEVFTSADLYFSLSGILHIVCLAADRYLAICYPFKYARIDRKFLVVSVISAWTLPLLFSFLPILAQWHRLGLSELYACLQGLEVHVCTMVPNKAFSTITFIIMFGLPSILMGFCYTQIYRVAMAQKEKMSTLTLGSYTTVQPAHSVDVLTATAAADIEHDTQSYVKDNLITNCRAVITDDSTFEPHTSLSGLDSDLGAEETLATVEQNAIHKHATKYSSCPELSVLDDGTRSNSFHYSLSFDNLSDCNLLPSCFQTHYITSAKKSVTTSITKVLRTSSSKRKVTFTLTPTPDKEDNFDTSCIEDSIWRYHVEDRNKPISPDCSSTHVSPETKIYLISGQRLEVGNGSILPKRTSEPIKLLFGIKKNRLEKKMRHLRSHKHGLLGEDFRTARSISIIIVCFAVTWCPYWVTMLIMPYLGPGAVPDPLIGACLWLAYVGSALNPFVYYFSNNSVKKGIKKRFLKFSRRD